MPDDRLIHRRLGHSEKVSSLTDFEFRVWVQYILSADDFGVMRFTPATLQADCDPLDAKNGRVIERALARLESVGLVRTFNHQSRTYGYQYDWQDWQKIDYPRSTLHPAPPLDELSEKTRELFAKHPGGWGRKVRGTFADGSPNVSRTVPEPLVERSGEITPEPLAVSRKPLAESREPVLTLPQRAGVFRDWYGEKHEQLFGVAYMGNPQKDYQTLLLLVEKFSDQQLRDAALVWFGMDDDFATRGTRTIPKFASRVTACLQTIQQRGIA